MRVGACNPLPYDNDQVLAIILYCKYISIGLGDSRHSLTYASYINSDKPRFAEQECWKKTLESRKVENVYIPYLKLILS